MTARNTVPPPVLDGARVLAYAVLDKSVAHTGRSSLYVNGKLLGAVPRLAIGQGLGSKDVLLLFCDDKWNSLGVVSSSSLKEAQERAEAEYRGVSAKWIHTSTSEKEAEQYLEQHEKDQVCSFCGKHPEQVEQMFQSPTACICNECVAALSKNLPRSTRGQKKRGTVKKKRSTKRAK